MCGCAGGEVGSDWQCSDSACCQVAGRTPHDALQVTHCLTGNTLSYRYHTALQVTHFSALCVACMHVGPQTTSAMCQRSEKHMVFCFMHTVTVPAATWLEKHLMTLYRYHIALLMQVHCLLTTYCIVVAWLRLSNTNDTE